EDRISQLPDPLICQILSCLHTKDAVKTSILSTRWKTLWLWVPVLVLDSHNFTSLDHFVSFGDKYFDSSRVSYIRELNLYILDGFEDGDISYLKSWINAAVERKIQHIDVLCPAVNYHYEMPLSLYTCKTLVLLKLQWVILADAEVFSLPCLKTMHLDFLIYHNEATFEKLVSCCPVLEELKISVARNDSEVIRVHSRSLKRLTFIRLAASYQFDSVFGAVIDAPLLRFLSVFDNVSKIVVNNLDSCAKLDISLNFDVMPFNEASVLAWRSRIRSFLPGISRVREMAIDADTFKVIHDYSKLEPLPQFRYMSRLCASLCVSDLECLPTFLESFPNLKSFTLRLKDHEEMPSEEMNQISYSSVPACLLSSLEFVHFLSPISGYAAEMKLVRYFLENSALLKILTVSVNSDSIDYEIFKELLKIPRRSTTCQVVASSDW
ncbi:hypothetical protein EUTSA_v10015300mg, partial [Eutrema salsugineum]